MTRRAVLAELRSIRRGVDRWAAEWGIAGDVLVDLQLALGEAVANGIEHAYGPDEPGLVDVELELCDHRAVAVRVTDHGRWQPRAASPGYRGRGLMMIERLAQAVRVQASPRGTQVCFEIPLAA
jgi:anti-sigma regulatory factor (Ser/Thr protein kinase)